MGPPNGRMGIPGLLTNCNSPDHQYHFKERLGLFSPLLRSQPIPQEETFEEPKVRENKEATPQTSISSISDEVVMPPSPSLANNFSQFQDLIKRVADTLKIPLKEVQDSQHNLFGYLAVNTTLWDDVTHQWALLDLAKTV